MLDRGEDDDWFGSPLIRLVGAARRDGHLVGAVAWLLLTDKPVVDLRALGGPQLRRRLGDDRRCIGAVLYSSSLLIPLLAQDGWATPRCSPACCCRPARR